MAQQHIALGSPPGGETGDTNRAAWVKAEANFNELYTGVLTAMGRNYIINGGFDIWQRATSFTNAGSPSKYTADRFLCTTTGDNCNVLKGDFGANDSASDYATGSTSFLRATTTSVAGASNLTVLRQLIEGVRTLAGKKATISFYALAVGADTPIAVEMSQLFGAGGTAEAPIAPGQKFIISAASWTKVVVTFDVPSLAGKTIGSNNALALNLWLSAGSTFNARTASLGQRSSDLLFSKIQVEEGATATNFDRRPIAHEMMLCQRYYEKRGLFFSAYGLAGSTFDVDVPYTVVKRITPALVWPSASYINCSGVSGAVIEIARMIARVTITANGSINLNASWTLDAEL